MISALHQSESDRLYPWPNLMLAMIFRVVVSKPTSMLKYKLHLNWGCRNYWNAVNSQYQHHKPTRRHLTLTTTALFQCDIGQAQRVNPRILPVSRHTSFSSHAGEIDTDIDDETMTRHNALSRRLYRILLQTCKQGVIDANCENSIESVPKRNNAINDNKTWILLQPSMDHRRYGFAKIVEARRGRDAGNENKLPSTTTFNKAANRMSSNDVGMAMEVLRFVHMSMGGSIHDDLEEYYLTGKPSYGDGDDFNDDNDETDDFQVNKTPAAGRHSEGHYTHFIDDDEERGEHHSDANIVDDDSNEEEEEGSVEIDESVLVTVKDLQNAIRIAFRANLIPSCQSKEDAQPISTIIARRQRDAIDACSQLSEQFSLWGRKSSVSTDWERGVRVVATSSLMLKPTPGAKGYRFSYRIRVENISDIIDNVNEESRLEHRGVQLLGRTWKISEHTSNDELSSSMLQKLIEIGSTDIEPMKEDQRKNDSMIVQIVNEPKTGAVGHLPVLGPGEVFEYMSGAELSTPTGSMEGCFHMAHVDMQTTNSAHVGDQVEALKWSSNDERRFEMPVAKFGLVADENANRSIG